MLIRTSGDFGAVIRDRRKQLKLDQAALARRIGVSRQWVIEMERGHPRAELNLVLRALDVLDIDLDVSIEKRRRRASSAADIDAIVSKARKTIP
jgi:y4mF family transcriptional regulator